MRYLLRLRLGLCLIQQIKLQDIFIEKSSNPLGKFKQKAKNLVVTTVKCYAEVKIKLNELYLYHV